ncbi:hypothetical protein BH10PSE1_BH10PSE1_21330 [soil metagenome]
MKSVFAALATALILPGVALAQTATPPAQTGAAARLPNTFDSPPQTARPTPAAPAEAPAQTPSDPATVAAAEAMLKTTVAAMEAGEPNYSDMTPDLAEKVRAQSANVLPLFQQLGVLQSVTHVGTQDGAELFTVVFANAPTQWIIALNPEGKITALLFRPAPAPGA